MVLRMSDHGLAAYPQREVQALHVGREENCEIISAPLAGAFEATAIDIDGDANDLAFARNEPKTCFHTSPVLWYKVSDVVARFARAATSSPPWYPCWPDTVKSQGFLFR